MKDYPISPDHEVYTRHQVWMDFVRFLKISAASAVTVVTSLALHFVANWWAAGATMAIGLGGLIVAIFLRKF